MSGNNKKNTDKSNSINTTVDRINREIDDKHKAATEGGKPKLSFYQRVDKFGDLVFLNLLFVVSCIPIITIGAAVTAMYAYLFKMVDDEEDTLWKGYWGYFKSNFKPATKVWCILLVIFGIMYAEYSYSLGMADSNAFIVTSIIALEAIFLSFTHLLPDMRIQPLITLKIRSLYQYPISVLGFICSLYGLYRF